MGGGTLVLLLLFSGHAASFAPPTTRPRLHRRPAIRVRVVDETSFEEQMSDGSLVELLVAEAEATEMEVAELEAICARGVCAVPEVACDESDLMCTAVEPGLTLEYLWPRLLLAFASILYGSNFPLGHLMNDMLPPSAGTSARMVLAAGALSPFLFKLAPEIRSQALLCGCFTAMGYITQVAARCHHRCVPIVVSLPSTNGWPPPPMSPPPRPTSPSSPPQSVSLLTTPAATVAFLGAATVVVCPTLEAVVDKKKKGLRDAPQTWLAAVLCITGVGILELLGGGADGAAGLGASEVGVGDLLALIQAVGFGTSFFLTERMMAQNPSQALPITAAQVSVSAALSAVWCVADGFIGTPDVYGLPGLLSTALVTDGGARTAALAIGFTGFITTAANRVAETNCLGKMSSAEASVILATEPLWAALILHDDFGLNDYVGGALIVCACLATSLKPEAFGSLPGFEPTVDAER